MPADAHVERSGGGEGEVKVQMFPSRTTAVSLVPSLEDVMPNHFCGLPSPVGVHVSPEFAETQMSPPLEVAASLVPSLDDVMSNQCCGLTVFGIQLTPAFDDVQMTSELTATAASLVPSLDDVMPLHVSPIRLASPVGVQLTPESIDV